jgi:hypothetical protein
MDLLADDERPCQGTSVSHRSFGSSVARPV